MTMILRNNTELSTESSVQWSHAGNDWLSNLNSAQTRQAYRKAWEQFMGFTGKYPHEVTQSDVIAFKTYLATDYPDKAAQADTTINLKLAALSSFYRFVMERGLLDKNPCDGVKRKAVNPYGKTTYLDATDNQDVQLLQQPDRSTLLGKRDYAIMLLLLTTGVRVSAIAEARIQDVTKHATGYVLSYTNKGGKTDKAALLPFVYDSIQDYLKHRGNAPKNAPLFVTDKSWQTGYEVKKFTRQAISIMISRYASEAGLHHVTAHSLRHTAAMIASQHGTIAQVKAFLKHSSARVTSIYLDHVNSERDTSDMTNAIGSRYS